MSPIIWDEAGMRLLGQRDKRWRHWTTAYEISWIDWICRSDPVWMQSIFRVLEEYHGFIKYCGFRELWSVWIEIFCSFENKKLAVCEHVWVSRKVCVHCHHFFLVMYCIQYVWTLKGACAVWFDGSARFRDQFCLCYVSWRGVFSKYRDTFE